MSEPLEEELCTLAGKAAPDDAPDPRTDEDHRRFDQETPALRLQVTGEKRRGRKKEPLPQQRFIIVDVERLKGYVLDWERLNFGQRLPPTELLKLLRRSRFRENTAKSAPQALNFARWWLRQNWRPKNSGDLPPDPQALRAFPASQLKAIAETLRDELWKEDSATAEQPPRRQWSSVHDEIARAIDAVMIEGARRRLAESGQNPDLALPPGIQLALRPVTPMSIPPKCGRCGADCPRCGTGTVAGSTAETLSVSGPIASRPPPPVRARRQRLAPAPTAQLVLAFTSAPPR